MVNLREILKLEECQIININPLSQPISMINHLQYNYHLHSEWSKDQRKELTLQK